jgi:hypothetical protein
MNRTAASTKIQRPFKVHKISNQLKHKVLAGSLYPVSTKPSFENFDGHVIMRIMSYLSTKSKISMSHVSPKILILPSPIEFRNAIIKMTTTQIESLYRGHNVRSISYQTNPIKRVLSLLEKGLFKYAARDACTIEDETQRSHTLQEIALEFFKNDPNQVGKAIQIVNNIEGDLRKFALRMIVLTSFKESPFHLEKMVQIANSLEYNYLNFELERIVIELSRNDPNQVDTSVQIPNTIEDDYRNYALGEIAIELSKNDPNQVDNAVQIAKAINGANRNYTLQRIAIDFLINEPNQVYKAVQIAKAIEGDLDLRKDTLLRIGRIFEKSLES